MVTPAIIMGSHANTIQVRKQKSLDRVKNLEPRWAPVLVTFIVGVCLLYISIPRTVAAFLTIKGDQILRHIEEGGKVSSDQLGELEQSRWDSLGWVENRKTYFDLTVVNNIRRPTVPAGDRRSVDEVTLPLIEQSLMLSPASARGWLSLAAVEMRLNGDSKRVADAMMASILTGPVLPYRTLYRLKLMLGSIQFMKSSDQQLLLRQVRIGWKVGADAAVMLSLASPRWIALFRAALASEPAEYDRYNHLLKVTSHNPQAYLKNLGSRLRVLWEDLKGF